MGCGCTGLTRRRLLTGGALAGTGVALGGCDRLGIDFPDLVSDAQVEAMGLRAWDEITATTPVARNDPRQQVIDDVARRCVRAAGERPDDWEVRLFDVAQVNAFALPGRKIGVYAGMFDVARSDAQLAAVIGHEIGHVQAEHAQERMSAEIAKTLGLRLIAIVLQLGDVEFAQGIAAALGLGAQYGLILPYGRAQELEADRLGLRVMAQAGFDPNAAVTLWQRMEDAGGDGPPAFLSTHPAPTARIEAIREMIPQIAA